MGSVQVSGNQLRQRCAHARVRLQTILLFSVYLAAPALAQDEQSDGELSAAAVAQKLADPNATLGQLSFPLDFVTYQGDLPGEVRQ